MARLFTSGFELGTTTLAAEGFTTQTGAATVTIDSSTMRSGARLKVVWSGTAFRADFNFTAVATRTYYCRFAINLTSLNAGGTQLAALFAGGGGWGIDVIITGAGVLTLATDSADGLLVTGPTLSTGQWYVIEASWNATTGAASLRVDGVSYGSGTSDTSSNTSYTFRLGQIGTATYTNFFDDCALNDDQGGAQNSWCGMGQVVLLKPASDSSRTGFTAGAGGTTNLYDALDNTPPVGVAQGSATNTSQILDNTSNTTDNYVANLQTYNAAGIINGSTIILAQAVVSHGNSTTTSRTNGIQSTFNPAIAEFTGTTGTTAAAAFPTGWTTLKSVVSYLPSVTLSSAPTIEFRKGEASTDYAMATAMGLLVEYLPAWARLFTTGFELQTTALMAEGFTSAPVGLGTCSIDTATKRSGAASLKVTLTANSWVCLFAFTAVLSQTYYGRIAFNMVGKPSINSNVIGLYDANNLGCEVRIAASDGTVVLATWFADNWIIYGPVLTPGVWYVIEWSYTPSTGAGQLWVDGVSYGTGMMDVATSTSFAYQMGTGSNCTWTYYVDDVALNSDQGSGQSVRCGMGNVVLLKPASDSARTGFTAGAGGTTNLYAAVDNTPPVGVAQGSATNTSQIKDNTSNTTDNYVANLQTYNAAGITNGSTIVLVQAVVSHGNSTTTSRTNGIQATGNPVIAETTGTTGTTAAAAYPTGWTTLKSGVSYLPSVTLGSAPTVEFRKGEASADYAMATLMGMYVEYLPGGLPIGWLGM